MRANQNLRVVVADDEPDMRDFYCAVLSRLGHQVVATATNGHELLEHCCTFLPDLVITDINMPGMDGIEAADRLGRECPVPVILVSAYHDTNLIARAGKSHIKGYLVKPIREADLKPMIALALRDDELQMAKEAMQDGAH